MSQPSALVRLVADYGVLYQKLRGYHWNVKGPWFFTLHAKFEELYGAAALGLDALAERLVAQGERPPATLAETLELASLEEDRGARDAMEMVRNIAADLEAMIGASRREAAEREVSDPTTSDLLRAQADGHEGQLWMLRAFMAA